MKKNRKQVNKDCMTMSQQEVDKIIFDGYKKQFKEAFEIVESQWNTGSISAKNVDSTKKLQEY